LDKKLVATLTIAIFLISTFAIVAPAQAHFTLGNLSGTNPYDNNNFDPHVAGPIGYVWPGSGQCAYVGYPNEASDNCAPGYQSPYPNGNPPGAPSNSWYQLEGDTYAPFGAVLTNSTGDLVFALNATCLPGGWTTGCAAAPNHEIQTTMTNSFGWDTWVILIPPEFTVPGTASWDTSQIVSTLSNSYEGYVVTKLGPTDRYAPGWTMVAVTADAAVDGPLNSAGQGYYNHQFINFTSAGEWYYLRINGVTAPSIAGRYFFKMYLISFLNTGQVFGTGPTLANVCAAGTTNCGENPGVWVPPQNWPVMLVKGETDPAIMTGTLRYAGYNSTLYQQPIAEAGKVWAHMTMRLDPYTGVQRPDLPTIDGQAYVNATANGHYELEGLAPGVYDIYAEAAGYPQALCVSGITVLKGQSLHFDCYLQPGPVIHGNVFTKHQFGDEPWPGNSTTGQYMKIELYSNPTLSNIVDKSAGSPVTWSPLPCVAGGQEDYNGGGPGYGAAGLCGDPRDGSAIAFPWHEYSTVNGAAPQYNDVPNPFAGATNGYTRDVAESVCLGAVLCTNGKPALTSDPMGVGPPQQWYVAGGTTNPFHFEMGLKGEYGAPRDLSGEVPQVYATWINGLTPGRYYVRAWTFRYVQTALDGATFQEYYFDITPNEWAGDVTLPIDLRLSSWVNKTVYFHDTPNTITTSPVHSGAGFIWGTLVGADGNVYSANVTALGLLEQASHVASTNPGLNTVPNYYAGCYGYDDYGYAAGTSQSGTFQTGEPGAPSVACQPTGNGWEYNALDKAGLNVNSLATGKATIQFWGINDTLLGENYGIPSGTYTPNVAVNGYYSPTPAEQVSVTLSGNPTSISDHLFLGPGFNVSVYSIDWERPRVSRPWVWSGCQAQLSLGCTGSEIDVGFYQVVNGTAGKLVDHAGGLESAFIIQPPAIGAFDDYGGLYQGPGGTDCITGASPSLTCTEMDGGGRNVLLDYSNSHDVYYGASARYVFVGGFTAGVYGFTTATAPSFQAAPLTWPAHFNEGQYNLAAYTYGYIQDKDFSAYAMNGQVADMKINLIIGVNVTLDILFKKESIITGTPYNMSGRVRLFNDQGQLVGEWMSSEGVYVPTTGHDVAANGILPTNNVAGGVGINPTYPFIDRAFAGGTHPATGLNSYNFIPGGTNLLHVVMAGLPQQVPTGSWIIGQYFADPIGVGAGACDFELDCYPAAYAQYPFPYTGIAGAPDYTGGWTAEVDFVPWYANNTGVPELGNTITSAICDTSTDNCGPQSSSGPSGTNIYAQYYPPVTGLLMGESYHIIPGTTALSGISLTEDMATQTGPTGVMNAFGQTPHSMAPNHLGPYSQEGVWQIAGTHNSGEASAIFEVDLNGFVSGNVLAFTWSNEFRTLSWGAISVTGAPGGATWNFYTWDGVYGMFLPTGSYQFSIAQPGYAAQSWSVSVSPGQTGTGQNVYLEQSNIPVPEFSGVAVVAFSALAASVYLLRRRRE